MTIQKLSAEQRAEFAELQAQINSLSAWRLEGSVGRGLSEALSWGVCVLGFYDTRDYYGNYIPSRDQVKAGTKGSYDFVRERFGKKYADYISSVGDPEKLTGRARLLAAIR